MTAVVQGDVMPQMKLRECGSINPGESFHLRAYLSGLCLETSVEGGGYVYVGLLDYVVYCFGVGLVLVPCATVRREEPVRVKWSHVA